MLAQTARLLLPALFPSWRFFKEVGPSPRLELNMPGTGWEPAFCLPARVALGGMLRRLVRNGEWNEYLYIMSLAERLDETGEADLDALLTERLELRFGTQLKRGWQFRIVFVEGEARVVSYESAPVLRAA